RELLYEVLGLPEPSEPTPLVAWAPPVPERVGVCSFVMLTRVRDGRTVEVSRFPAAVRGHVAKPADGWTGHLSAGDDEWDLRMLQSAEVLSRATATIPAEAWQWALTTLRQFPGSAVACASTADGCVATLRDGRQVRVKTESGDLDVAALAACLYALARNQRLTDGEWQVRTARGEARVKVRLLPRL
ncbi:MAG TPA: hypothetical protein VFG35_00185, partial [Actinoplanes sp.]|nr:hypothetical protein [Actinoplanes sp.]